MNKEASRKCMMKWERKVGKIINVDLSTAPFNVSKLDYMRNHKPYQKGVQNVKKR